MHEGATSESRGDHAVVIGAGMAGLLAASVLASRFGDVTLVEKDSTLSDCDARKGAPQGSHIHLLLVRGAEVIEELIPGISDDLASAGGLVADSTRDLAFYNFGAWQPRGVSKLPTRLQTRPFLEWHVARRVAALSNVRFLRGHTARSPRVGPAGRVTGLLVSDSRTGAETTLDADLVVDAAGRGSRTPRWLTAMGFQPPEATEVDLPITYASRFFRVTRQPHDWAAMLVYPRVPREVRGGALYFQEGDRWILTLASYAGEDPPRTDEEFLAFAKGLPCPEIHRTVAVAQPLSPIRVYRYPGARRLRYERLRRLPEGLLVIGDALCSFNPVFGQGMTSAALQARWLGTCLDRFGLAGLPRRFSRGAARICDAPWLMSTSLDLRYPHAVGRRSRLQPLVNWYLDHLFEAAAGDFELLRDFMRALHLVSPPSLLARPRTLGKLAASAFRGEQPPRPQRPPLSAYSEAGDLAQIPGINADEQ